MGLQMMATTEANRKLLFYELGANWIWLLSVPAAATAVIFMKSWSGASMHLVVLLIFLVLVSGFVGFQVKPVQIQCSVELTDDTLRRDAETILVTEILKILSGSREFTDVRQGVEAVAVGAGAWLIGCGAARPRWYRTKAQRGSYRAGLGPSYRHSRAALTPLVQESVEPA